MQTLDTPGLDHARGGHAGGKNFYLQYVNVYDVFGRRCQQDSSVNVVPSTPYSLRRNTRSTLLKIMEDR